MHNHFTVTIHDDNGVKQFNLHQFVKKAILYIAVFIILIACVAAGTIYYLNYTVKKIEVKRSKIESAYNELIQNNQILNENMQQTEKFLKIKKEVKIEKDGKLAKVTPSKETTFSFKIDFNHPAIGEQIYKFNFSTENYLNEISKARTFGFLKEIQYLRSKGLALGGSLDNAIVLDDKKILNENLRYNDEFVRHKILDAIGDMRLLGYNFIGDYEAVASGHHLNHLLTKEIFSNAENYEFIEMPNIEREFSLATSY